MQSMIKRGVLAMAAVVMACSGIARAAEVSVEYLYAAQTGQYFGSPTTGYQSQTVYHQDRGSYLWDIPTQSGSVLTADSYSYAVVRGVGPSQEAGYASSDGYTKSVRDMSPELSYLFAALPDAHAYLWQGSDTPGVDLHPAGYSISYALATDGSHQVGAAALGANGAGLHAMLWNGTAASAKDLNPTGTSNSIALAVNGQYQAGVANTGNGNQAALWQGSAESFVNLGSLLQGSSYVTAIEGDQQFGSGIGTMTRNQTHALMWSGTADSVVDLHPSNSNYTESHVIAASADGIQIGYAIGTDAYGSRIVHAIAWQGSAESYIDLSAVLDNQSPWSSLPLGIDGNSIYGVAYDNGPEHNGPWFVKWTIVPEPGSLSLLGLAGLGLLKRRRRSPIM